MQQRAHIFHRLEATETMRAYVARNVDKNEDFLANLETTKSEVAAAWELVEESVSLMRKVEEEKETSQTEACQLAEKKTAMAAKKQKAEEKIVQLKQELQYLRAKFDFTLVS